MEKETIESTNKLLRVIIALILKRKDPEIFTLRQQIEILNDLGLKPLEIAQIIGRSNIYVNKELSKLRKSQKEKE
jgi:hypothetical protein